MMTLSDIILRKRNLLDDIDVIDIDEISRWSLKEQVTKLADDLEQKHRRVLYLCGIVENNGVEWQETAKVIRQCVED